MAKITSVPDWASMLTALRDEAASKLATHLCDRYLDGIKEDANQLLESNGIAVEEGGHVHEAVLTAVQDLTAKLPDLGKLSKYNDSRSYDSKARKGSAMYSSNARRSRFSLKINLPFAATMEAGGEQGVKPSGGSGIKTGTGLYGSRSNIRTGYLIWRSGRSGQVRFTLTRSFSGTRMQGAMKRALVSTEALANQMGWR